MTAEKEMDELVKEAVDHCKANKCDGCPFDGSPACCVTILYVSRVTKGAKR